jgi:cellulose synthase/poly-beta-1,6-N-acetylglucosamine synthase-like glycosyltransferase
VLTAARARDQHLLPRAHASLRAQGVSWQWLVEVDGPAAAVWSPDDDRVTVRASHRALGVSAARNLALVDVRTPYVVVLDADDTLPPDALRYVVDALQRSGSFALSGSLREVNGSSAGDRIRLPMVAAGTHAAGAIPAAALALGMLPTPTQAVTFRADALRAVGGWPGMVLCQDVAAFMLVAQRWPVDISHHVVYEYHRRPGQSTDPTELAKHDLMRRSRLLLAQQLQARTRLSASASHVMAVTEPTY